MYNVSEIVQLVRDYGYKAEFFGVDYCYFLMVLTGDDEVVHCDDPLLITDAVKQLMRAGDIRQTFVRQSKNGWQYRIIMA